MPDTKETWTETHMQFADMGGFVIAYACKDPEPSEDDDFPGSTSLANRQASTAGRGDSHISTSGFTPLLEHKATRLWYLRAKSTRVAIERGLLAPTSVFDQEINDKAKGSAVTKSLAIGQISYYLVEVVTRLLRGRPISPMELGVTAFVLCTIVTYLFWYRRPQGVTEATKIGVLEGDVPDWLKELNLDRDILFGATWVVSKRPGDSPSNFEMPVLEAGGRAGVGMNSFEIFLFIPICTLFGALHMLLGENLTLFAGALDRWLWYVAATFSAVVYPSLVCVSALFTAIYMMRGTEPTLSAQGFRDPSMGSRLPLLQAERHFNSGRRLREREEYDPSHYEANVRLLFPLFTVAFAFYALSKLILIGIMFSSLLYLPPSSFINTWTADIPHVG